MELNEIDYKVILSWYEMAFAGKDRHKPEDLATMNKIGVMAKSFVESVEHESKE